MTNFGEVMEIIFKKTQGGVVPHTIVIGSFSAWRSCQPTSPSDESLISLYPNTFATFRKLNVVIDLRLTPTQFGLL